MAITPRQLAVFALSFALGAAAIAGLWILLNSFSLRVAENPKTAVSTAPAAVPASEVWAACPAQPAAPMAREKDGKFVTQADLSGNTATDTVPFIVVGKEAAAAGRPRDAEVAFLMACRIADKFKGSRSLASADARYQLAWHYEWLAHEGGPAAGANRAELLKRADSLYSDSLKVYLALYGRAHEKSRFAADGLAAVRQILAEGQTVRPPAPAVEKPAGATMTAKATASVSPTGDDSLKTARAQPRGSELAQTRPSTVRERSAANQPRPSFDCSKARSVPEKMICSDAELSRLDRDLGRVYVRAKNSASNNAAFRRQNNEEWRRRESMCRDRECLLRWYAQRRDQLSNDINQAKRPSAPMASRESVL